MNGRVKANGDPFIIGDNKSTPHHKKINNYFIRNKSNGKWIELDDSFKKSKIQEGLTGLALDQKS